MSSRPAISTVELVTELKVSRPDPARSSRQRIAIGCLEGHLVEV
jgi:hypothetical protein